MRTLLFISLIALLFTSCMKERLEANGNRITELRTPGTFDGILSSGSTPVYITYGKEYRVELRGSSNLISSFKTRVDGNTLDLGYKDVNVYDSDIEVHITMPEVESINLSGSGRVNISRYFPAQNNFRLRVSGSGNVDLNNELEVNNTDIEISGSGKARLEKLLTENAEVNISGSGDVWLSVSNHLSSRISGSGKVFYIGNPTIDSRVSGSGGVVKY